ncbi:MAG: 30S ribosomal protein S10 [Microgenomates group bacterium GW2011_GWF2_45_18]|nr:MAG: 30S ribosomal protein S10 [Microgenomates group bacterium GW2011_GWF1_44_10]KKU01966.1 MAG: 30S ribosomal protein S10 [Microgenomates group bacterium GW2011_GWF2_45_18]OGJ41020.1 MAG: 30S ribosomal protein S10 [Candidatus Pacebacteria bacterium RIFOXYB1_FULL_44_10]HAU99049.1 30S ribosomal protein S10 [Candidatus Paceibacterota bacterium]HAX01236.1 30S ribosomal protein S10 [Candidatus Paceibacterota bacterium]
MTKGKIRVRLKSFDHRVVDDAAKKILDTALSTGAKVVGPVPLPTERKVITVLKSPHTDKNAQEHFEVLTHKRVVDIVDPTSKTIDALMHLELPAGVGIQIKM